MSFKIRTKAPLKSNNYYKQIAYGGLNRCINIKDGYVLPNCVGYAWGRAYEVMKTKPKLSTGNAEDWWSFKDGYYRSQSPRIGAIACWRKGKVNNLLDGYGHIAFVEKIDDKYIYLSESSYGGQTFRYYAIDKSMKRTGQVFQGFIYLPIAVTTKPKKTNEQIADEVINGKWDNGSIRKSKLEKAGYNYNTIQSIVNKKLNITTKKSNKEIAKEVIQGKWGNGATRKSKLEKAGYNYNTIQKLVNEILR